MKKGDLFESDVWIEGDLVWVKLNLAEAIYGANVGVMRHYESKLSGREANHGFDEDKENGLGIDVLGGVGEVVVAKALGRYYAGTVNTFKEADIGKTLQVRATPSHKNRLIFRDDDDPEHIFILVTGTGPLHCIRGWLLGKDCMKEEYIKNPNERGPAYFVPQRLLNSITPKIKI